MYTERELRLSFLQSRGAWLHSVLNFIPTTNPYTYVRNTITDIHTAQLTKLTDASRTHLFDIITQYRAIFSDETAQDDPMEDGGLLYGWINEIIGEFLKALNMYR